MNTKVVSKKIIRTSVAIVGAGPIGLACAIDLGKAGIDYLVLEKGSLTNGVRRFPKNMTFFSTPELVSIGDIPFPTVGVRPTRDEALEYYLSVSDRYQINMMLYTKVELCQIVEGMFILETNRELEVHADFVIFATGYYDTPVKPGIPGENLEHVKHYLEEAYPYSKTKAVVVGAGNSAVETALDLYRHKAEVTLIHRGDSFKPNVKTWIKPDIVNRVAKGEIASHFNSQVLAIEKDKVIVQNDKSKEHIEVPADFVFLHCGFVPSTELPKSLGVKFDDRLIPQFDPTTFETNVPRVFIVGTPTAGVSIGEIFIENGREHAPVVCERIAQYTRETNV
jgi:thioredoxin reductase (NADPH)